jgi:hypothetical protein
VNANGSSKDPLAQALDLFVYAPIGLAVTMAYRVPKLVTEARTQLAETQKRLAGVGHMAVMFGQYQVKREVDSRLAEARRRAEQVAGSLPGTRRPDEGDGEVPTAANRMAGAAATPVEATSLVNSSQIDADALPIPAYDGLSASQVVQRLTGLTPEELETVRAYEAGGRGRKTVLNAIDRLRA